MEPSFPVVLDLYLRNIQPPDYVYYYRQIFGEEHFFERPERP